MKYRLLSLFLTLVALTLASALAWATEYKAYDLAPAGATGSLFVNNQGEVVAYQHLPDGVTRLGLYNPVTQVSSSSIDLRGAYALDLNDQGQVLLNMSVSGHIQSALWDPVNGLMLLPWDEANPITFGRIDNAGRAVGSPNTQWTQTGPDYDIFLWDPAAGLKDLGACGHNNYVAAFNDVGQAVGEWMTSSGSNVNRGDFVWSRETGMVDIGHCGEISHATDINNNGQVTGAVRLADRSFGMFVWDSVNGYKIIYSTSVPQPGPGDAFINDNGEVVFSWSGQGYYTWDEANGVQFYPGWGAYDINNAGMITATMVGGRNVLLVPVPEPASILALTAGFIGLAGAAVRRRKR